jgi:hypothetical protein
MRLPAGRQGLLIVECENLGREIEGKDILPLKS